MKIEVKKNVIKGNQKLQHVLTVQYWPQAPIITYDEHPNSIMKITRKPKKIILDFNSMPFS